MSARTFDLLVFDWDGTLVDSAGGIVAAFQHAIDDLDLPARSNDEIASLIGLGMWEAMAVLFPDHPREVLEPMLRDHRERTGPRRMDYGALFPGAAATLRALQADGYRLAVATGKGRDGLEQSLDSSGLRDCFVATRTADEAPSKPAPDMLEELLWETDTPPDRALMIGDTDYDLFMARHARVAAVGVLCGVHPRARLLQAEPLALLPHVAELPDWLPAPAAPDRDRGRD